jgi:peptidoglycan/LPS O-acetylase OafA/YrhL
VTSYKAVRDPNIDLLRAIAILMVLAYHIIWWSPVFPFWFKMLSMPGAMGVDLFFILSGFLIGSIYWREERDTGDVRLMRFLKRRWLRTIPPYLAALALSWLAVRIVRHTEFDWTYLLFLQNYRAELPFFAVSWSLCVEEHFYLIVPLALSLTRRFRGVRPALMATGVIAPLLFRLSYVGQDGISTFGFYQTATHLHFEGLSLGMALAWVNIFHPARWDQAGRAARWAIVPLAVICLAGALWSREFSYVVSSSTVAALFAAVLLAVAGRRPIAGGMLAGPVRAIAVSSYSVYLIHTLIIHAGDVLQGRVLFLTDRAMLLFWPASIAAGGYIFYIMVERLSIALRDRIAPSNFSGGALAQQADNASVPIARELDHQVRA